MTLSQPDQPLLPEPESHPRQKFTAVEMPQSPEAPEGGLNIPHLFGIVRRKVMVITIVAIAFSAVSGFQASKQTPQYQSSFSLLVEPITQKRELSKLTGDQGGGTTKELDYSTQIEVLFSPQTLKQIIKKINERYPDVTFDSITSKLSIVRLGETKIIEVQYAGANPEKVKFVLHELSKGYLKHSLDDQKSTLRQGIAFVDKQLPAIQKRVSSLQEQIQELRQNYDFVDPDTYAQELSSQLAEIAKQRQTLKAEIVTLQTRYEILQQQLGVTVALSQASFYQEFLKQFQALDRQIAIESARFGDNSPTIKMLRQQQDNLEPLLRAEAKRAVNNQIAAVFNDLQVLKIREQSISQSASILSQRFQQIPAISKSFTDLQRDLKVATESLSKFLDTRESLEIQAARDEVPWQLITPPKPPESKVASNIYKSLASGAIVGLGMGAVLAYFLEKLEDTFYSIADLKKKVKLPILGVIPFRPDLDHAGPEAHIIDLRHLYPSGVRSVKEDLESLKQQMKALLSSGSRKPEVRLTPSLPTEMKPKQSTPQEDSYRFLEAFRFLHSSIQKLGTDHKLNSVVVSSALPIEGRTTIAVHLAQAAAAMGQRVLLVDAHLRAGGMPMHQLLGLPDIPGLSNLLREEATVNQVIQRLDWESGLFIVGAGSVPPDPTRLLASSQMRDFMQKMHKSFDLVIYDTLPLMGLADVNLLGGQVDGVILVAGFGKWRSADALKQTVERLRTAHIPVLGLVANGVKGYSVDLYNR